MSELAPILVAKSCADHIAADEVSLFPTERQASFRFSQEELLALSPKFARVYAALIAEVAPRLGRSFGLTTRVADVFAREGLPSLTHLFFDRLLRMRGVLAARPDIRSVASGTATLPVYRTEVMRVEAWRSSAFNQWVLQQLAPLWALPIVDRRCEDLPPPALKYLNNNYFGRTAVTRARRRAAATAVHALSRVFPGVRGAIPVLSMGYPSAQMQDHGLYWFKGFRDMRGAAAFTRVEPDSALRRDVLGAAIDAAAPELLALLADAEVTGVTATQAVALFAEFAMLTYPTALLEAVPVDLPRTRSVLAPFRDRALISAEAGNVEVTYFVAAARSLEMETIGFQQGGHYGYEEDLVSAVEMEYPFFDRFITWGWTRFPDAPAVSAVRPIPLPSPWLAVRRQQWARQLGTSDARYSCAKPYDILFMNNKIYPFPPAPSGAAISRVDHVHAHAQALADVVEGAATRGLSVFHKAYDSLTLQILSQTISRLLREHPERYKCPTEVHKGLTRDQLEQCHVVVWDQPGTGFLECTAAGIPTMIFWPRFYNQELPWTEPLFAALESAGVVHRSADGLLEEVDRFKQNPAQWIRDPARAAAIKGFLAEYGRADADWVPQWRRFIQSLRERRTNGAGGLLSESEMSL